ATPRSARFLARLPVGSEVFPGAGDLRILTATTSVNPFVIAAQQQDDLASRRAEEDPEQNAFGLRRSLREDYANLLGYLRGRPPQSELIQTLAERLAELGLDDIGPAHTQNML